eukprot:CAMPEP_0202963010 /NCGR_PEP_ID=MMETSP1396-20130829/7015_1 /ASSEMBLY_ACC=CAM_ASM_000872 /TAXON_ID= /ORGANISM="Pseudokeronopsis sp., Strain Brazil" /LENGTH=198 /DNA_ID=CAMNT_0049683901 /DNA_START=679 /DNA_END=1278 /DNA_ORIENTATION=-
MRQAKKEGKKETSRTVLTPSTQKRAKDARRTPSTMGTSKKQEEVEDKKSQRKLGQKESDDLYARMMLFENRKQKAIKMMQEAKEKEAELENHEASLHKLKKMNLKEAEGAYLRLSQDAEKRRANMKLKREADLLKEEEELKLLFKPKINNKFQSRHHKRDDRLEGRQEMSREFSLEKKIEMYEKEAHCNKKYTFSKSP